MSKRLTILTAIKQMIVTACSTVTVIGFDEATVKPERIPDGGLILGEAGDPGDPEITLSPPIYEYEHAIPVELIMPPGATDAQLDAILASIGAAVDANVYLGGLVDYLTCSAPVISSENTTGVDAIRSALFNITAHYGVTNPLSG